MSVSLTEEFYQKIYNFTESFVDNLECNVIILFYATKYAIKDSKDEVNSFKVKTKLLESPIRALEGMLKKLEQLLEGYKVKIQNNRTPTTEELREILQKILSKSTSSIDIRKQVINACTHMLLKYQKDVDNIETEDMSIIAKALSEKVLKYYLFESKTKTFNVDLVCAALNSKFDSNRSFLHLSWNKICDLLPEIRDENSKFASIKTKSGTTIQPENFFIDCSTETVYEESTEQAAVKYVTERLRDRELHEKEDEVLEYIEYCKHTMLEEVESMKKQFFLAVFEQMSDVLDKLEHTLNAKEETEEDKEERRKAQINAGGGKTIAISKNTMKNWNATFN